jgi:hypothetical protein
MKAYLGDLGTFCASGRVVQPHQLTLKLLTAMHNASPKAAALLRGNMWAPSSDTLERASRSAYGLHFHADGVQTRYVEAACKYFKSVGYTGYLQISMDATAVSPIVRLDQTTRQLVGFMDATGPMTSPEDITAAFEANKGKKVSQAQLILLAPSAGGISPIPIGIVPRGAGKDQQTNIHVYSWYSTAVRLTGCFGYPTSGLAADGDSAVRFVYEERCCLQFRDEHASDDEGSDGEGEAPAARGRGRQAGLTRGALALPQFYVCIQRPTGRASLRTTFAELTELVTIDGRAVPHALCPITDPLHECKKLRNQLLNGVNRALWIGDYMISLEHIRVIYREHRTECGLRATDVNVNDKQNTDAAANLLNLDGKWLDGLDGQGEHSTPRRHATPCHATPRHATPRHATPCAMPRHMHVCMYLAPSSHTMHLHRSWLRVCRHARVPPCWRPHTFCVLPHIPLVPTEVVQCLGGRLLL